MTNIKMKSNKRDHIKKSLQTQDSKSVQFCTFIFGSWCTILNFNFVQCHTVRQVLVSNFFNNLISNLYLYLYSKAQNLLLLYSFLSHSVQFSPPQSILVHSVHFGPLLYIRSSSIHLNPFRSFWPTSVHFRPLQSFLSYSVQFSPPQSILTHSVHLISLARINPYLPFRPTSVHFSLFGPLQSFLSHSVHFSPPQSILVISVNLIHLSLSQDIFKLRIPILNSNFLKNIDLKLILIIKGIIHSPFIKWCM